MKIHFNIISIYNYKMVLNYFRKASQFVIYTLIIYFCYITSAIYHQKILKHKYQNIFDQSQDSFQAPIIFTLFPPLFSTIIGFFLIKFQQKPGATDLQIPIMKSMVCSLIITINMWTYNKAIAYSSFSVVIMIKSCSLLSVILVGVFCSRVKDQSVKLGIKKLRIGVIASIGIILFNCFKNNQNDSDKPLNIFGIMLLFVSLLGDGFLPDFQAEIKAQFKPTAFQMYYHINKSTTLIAIAYCISSFQIAYIFNFITSHQQILTDIITFSVLNSFGQLVIYQMIKLFKQHVPSFVIATRKCFTVIVNIVYFGHQINSIQFFGILFVFFAVMMQVYQNYKQSQQKIKNTPFSVSDTEQQDFKSEQKLNDIVTQGDQKSTF